MGVNWPDEHVAWQQVLEGDPDMSVPFDVHVFIFHTSEQLQAACGNPLANGHSSTWTQPDSVNIGALVMLAKDELELSVVAHEAAHIALFHHRNILTGRISARRWLNDHPEHIAEMIGNLTAIIWYNLPDFTSEAS